jgi:ankyrin repeat protein
MTIIGLLAKNPHTKLDLGDLRHNTPLAFAIRQNRWDIAELLVEAGANVNTQIVDDDGNTPLHKAAGSGDVKRVQWLLAKGADTKLTNYRQLTPRAVARSSEIVKLLEP